MIDITILALLRVAIWIGIGVVMFIVAREVFIAAINWIFDINEKRWWH